MSSPYLGGLTDRLTELMADRWPGWLGGEAPELHWVLESTARPVAQTSVILYAIDPTKRQPVLVAKVSRDPRFGFVVEDEHDRAIEARQALGEDQRGTVPRPFDLIRTGEDVYLISEFAPEGLHWDHLTTADQTRLADQLAAWVAVLHGRSQRPLGAFDQNPPEEIVTTYIDAFDPPLGLVERLHQAAESMTAELAAGTTDILVHGDFWPGNWRMSKGEFKVIDWESAHWSPSPALDEFLFPLSNLTRGHQRHGAEAEQDLTWFSNAYRRHRGLPLRAREEAELVATWCAAEVATRTHRRWGVVEDWAMDWHRVLIRLALRR